VPGDEGPVQVDDARMAIIPDPGQGKITVKVPRAVLGDDPENWAYAAVVMSQDGYPSTGVWRVRDVNPSAQQYRLGGGPDDENHTRIIDVLWPPGAAPTQEEMLSTYAPSQQSPSGLGPDDFAQLEMLRP
jgi:carbohydrate-binding DOMON domain-containing protein